MNIFKGNLGPESNYNLQIVGDQLVAEIDYDGGQLDGSLVLKLDVGAILDVLKAKIPGAVDDVVFDLIKTALKANGEEAISKPSLAGQ